MHPLPFKLPVFSEIHIFKKNANTFLKRRQKQPYFLFYKLTIRSE